MKILFIGAGMTDYIVQLLNKLNSKPDVEIYNLIDANGVGHVPAGAHQTRKGVEFAVVELRGTVRRKYSDHSYWSFVGLARALREVKPDVVIVSEKYIQPFLHESDVREVMRECGTRLVFRDNPFRLERYEARKEAIMAGLKDEEYTPFYVLYLMRAFERLGFKNQALLKQRIYVVLSALGLYTKERGRKKLLERLEEKKYILNAPDAHTSYIEEAYELYGTYGVPREKIFIIYNSPDTDLLFAVRKQIEQEPPVLPPNPRRVLHVGRLIPWKRVDMLIRSVGTLSKEFPDAQLVVVGYGPQEAELKALVKTLGLAKVVMFVGGVYDPTLLGKYFMSASVYVLAGMGGLSINDAMTFGRPIICSVGDGTEKKLVFEGRNGLYFIDGNEASLTEKIRYIFEHPTEAQKMGEESTNIIKNDINIHTVMKGYMDAFAYARAH